MIRELTEGIGDTETRTGRIEGGRALRAGASGAVGGAGRGGPGSSARREPPRGVRSMNVPVVDDALAVFDEREPINEKTALCDLDFDIPGPGMT